MVFRMKLKKIWMSMVTLAVLVCLTVLPVLALTGQVATASDPLRVRTGPGTGYSVLYQDGKVVQLAKGTSVTILKEVMSDLGDTANYPVWYQITATFNGKTVTGYVASNYIKVIPDSSTGGNTEIDDIIYTYPEAYRPYLKDLVAEHPNWVFTFFETGLDWNTVMDNECYRGAPFRNVTKTDAYKYKDADGNYLQSPEGWYQASDEVIAYYMDPRNHMTESGIFQFELLSYDASLHNLAGVEAILKGSFMENAKISDDNGNLITYAEAIMIAAQTYDASPYYLATKIIQEVGRSGSGSTSGTYIAKDGTNCSGYYNFYNIQATSSTNDPIKQGLQWAAESGSYGRPWTTPFKSILGGAQYITKTYIARGQDTIYLQKFDVDNSDGQLYWHQYMTNVAGASSEASIQYKGYVDMNMTESSFIFSIPIYENLPANRCRLPGDTSVDPDPIPDPDPDVTKPTDPDVTDPDVTEPSKPDVTDPTDPDVTDPTEPSNPVASKLGDVNGDGSITAVDARWALQKASGVRTLTEQQTANADVNGDGNITAVDARWILQAASGIREFA